jgi:predicted RNA-binding Zn ribbon-like protein
MKSASRQALETMMIPAPAEMLCLDFVNTLYWRGSQPQTETLTDIAALAAWVGKDGGLPAERAQELAAWAKDHPANAAKLFTRAITLREAIHNLFVARASDKPVSDADVSMLNEALAEAPSRDALSKTRTQFGWKVPRGDITAPAILAPVLWSAADLLLKGDPARIRQCANEKCRWVFLDISKAGARRWCTMNSCGNRAKAHRHYHKAKAAEK